jgi:hypothetical protein
MLDQVFAMFLHVCTDDGRLRKRAISTTVSRSDERRTRRNVEGVFYSCVEANLHRLKATGKPNVAGFRTVDWLPGRRSSEVRTLMLAGLHE